MKARLAVSSRKYILRIITPYRPVVMYGSETRTIEVKEVKYLKVLRCGYGERKREYNGREKITNEIVLKRIGEERI